MHWVKSFMPKHFWCFVRFFLVLLVSLFQLQKLMPMWSRRRLTMLPYFDGSAGRGMWKLLAWNRNRFNSINVNCQNPLRIAICLLHTDKKFIYLVSLSVCLFETLHIKIPLNVFGINSIKNHWFLKFFGERSEHLPEATKMTFFSFPTFFRVIFILYSFSNWPLLLL